MSDFPLRLARADEHEAVAACVDAAYSKWIARIGRKPGPMLDDYAELIGRGVVYVLPDEADTIRALIVTWVQDGDADADAYMWIDNLAVQPAEQGSGIGRMLIAFAEDRARESGLNEIRLLTNALMTENIAFYERGGFEVLERKTLENGGGLVVMVRRLVTK